MLSIFPFILSSSNVNGWRWPLLTLHIVYNYIISTRILYVLLLLVQFFYIYYTSTEYSHSLTLIMFLHTFLYLWIYLKIDDRNLLQCSVFTSSDWYDELKLNCWVELIFVVPTHFFILPICVCVISMYRYSWYKKSFGMNDWIFLKRGKCLIYFQSLFPGLCRMGKLQKWIIGWTPRSKIWWWWF